MNELDELLIAVENGEHGWSVPWGGPEGVARRCNAIFDEMRATQVRLAFLRAAAVEEMLRTQPGVEVADALGVSKSAISKIRRREPTEIVW